MLCASGRTASGKHSDRAPVLQELRALVEGARFILHLENNTVVRHVWYSRSSSPPTVRWQSSSTLPQIGNGNKLTKRKQNYWEKKASSLINIVYGAHPCALGGVRRTGRPPCCSRTALLRQPSVRTFVHWEECCVLSAFRAAPAQPCCVSHIT